MSNPVNTFQVDAATESALRLSLSAARLDTYLQAAGGNAESAFALHVRNAALGAAFFGPLQALEVALRNAMHRELAATYSTQWWSVPAVGLDGRAVQTLAATQAELNRRNRLRAPSDVVGALSFGFWVALLTRGGPRSAPSTVKADYEATLWRPALHRAFPHARLNRKQAHAALDGLRELRNRIAHHEPIFLRNLQADWSTLQTALGWLCPVTRDWVVHHCRVQALLQVPLNVPVAL